MKTTIIIKESGFPFLKKVSEDIGININKTEESFTGSNIEVTVNYESASQLFNLGLITAKEAGEAI